MARPHLKYHSRVGTFASVEHIPVGELLLAVGENIAFSRIELSIGEYTFQPLGGSTLKLGARATAKILRKI